MNLGHQGPRNFGGSQQFGAHTPVAQASPLGSIGGGEALAQALARPPKGAARGALVCHLLCLLYKEKSNMKLMMFNIKKIYLVRKRICLTDQNIKHFAGLHLAPKGPRAPGHPSGAMLHGLLPQRSNLLLGPAGQRALGDVVGTPRATSNNSVETRSRSRNETRGMRSYALRHRDAQAVHQQQRNVGTSGRTLGDVPRHMSPLVGTRRSINGAY